MKIAEDIIRMIKEARYVCAPVTNTSNLYTDLGYDSLTFVRLLLNIEKKYSIKFELMEMSTCLHIGRLIALVEHKVNEANA